MSTLIPILSGISWTAVGGGTPPEGPYSYFGKTYFGLSYFGPRYFG